MEMLTVLFLEFAYTAMMSLVVYRDMGLIETKIDYLQYYAVVTNRAFQSGQVDNGEWKDNILTLVKQCISFNLYAIMMLAMIIGNSVSRSRLVDFFLNSSKKVTINVVAIIFFSAYTMVYGFIARVETESPNISYLSLPSVLLLMTLCFFNGIPLGIAYCSAFYRGLGGRSNKELLYLFENQVG
jgi:hypothetical protein